MAGAVITSNSISAVGINATVISTGVSTFINICGKKDNQYTNSLLP